MAYDRSAQDSTFAGTGLSALERQDSGPSGAIGGPGRAGCPPPPTVGGWERAQGQNRPPVALSLGLTDPSRLRASSLLPDRQTSHDKVPCELKSLPSIASLNNGTESTGWGERSRRARQV